MRNSNSLATLAIFAAALPAFGQSAPVATSAATVIPALIRFTGTDANSSAKPLSSMTFLIFKDEKGGEPLWTETQSVPLDSTGKYEVYLGATNSSGLPLDLFGTGEARWLDVQIAGERQQPRVLLTSVPYAIKAADAATLGGLPASAFVLAGSPSTSLAQTSSAGAAATNAAPDGTSNVTTTGGTSNYIPKFTGTSTVANSEIYDTGTGVGIGKEPSANIKLDVDGAMIMRGNMQVTRTGNATSSKAYPSYGFQFYSNLYNSSSKASDNPYYQLQSEPTGNNTSSPSATFNLLFANNASAVAETGLYFNPNGTIHFAPGQTFDTTSSSGVGIEGTSTSGVGIEGNSTSGYGAAGTSVSGAGVYGTSGSGNGTFGSTNGTQLNTAGTYGEAGTGNTSGFGGIAGVWGDASAHVGVLGTSDKFAGVQGVSSTGTGVQGQSTSGAAGNFTSGGYLASLTANNTGTGQSIYAQSVATNGEALYADSEGVGSIAVYGISTGGYDSPSNPSVGVEGNGGSYGVDGLASAGVGVFGVSESESSTGSYLTNYGFRAGVWGDSSADGDNDGSLLGAVTGTADNNYAGFLENDSNSYSTLHLQNNGSAGVGGDVAGVLQATGAHGMCGIGSNGDLACTGQVKSLSTTSSSRTVETYAMQSPENWIEDFGSGSLTSGTATVFVDTAFAETANTGDDYHVFLTARGDSDGLYVTNLTATSFEVHESRHGTSSMTFDYRIVANAVDTRRSGSRMLPIAFMRRLPSQRTSNRWESMLGIPVESLREFPLLRALMYQSQPCGLRILQLNNRRARRRSCVQGTPQNSL